MLLRRRIPLDNGVDGRVGALFRAVFQRLELSCGMRVVARGKACLLFL